MQEMVGTSVSAGVQEHALDPISLLDLPEASLQIVQASDTIEHGWLDRPTVSPVLSQNADGLWLLTVRRQGVHGGFNMPYIGSEILMADAEMGLIVVLVGYHGTEAYGRKKEKHVQKGQLYRYYQQQASGEWRQLVWRQLNDELRGLVLDLEKPEWARQPGKLSSERKPPAKMIEMISYKVVRLIDGRYFSLYDPTVEYILGERVKQPAKPGHKGGFFSYPTIEHGESYLANCVRMLPFHSEVETPALALLECEIGGRIIHYGHKMASTYLRPLRVLEIRGVQLN
jgi:hypothetical protein